MKIRTILLTLTVFCCLLAGGSVIVHYKQSDFAAQTAEKNAIKTSGKLLAVELDTAFKSYKNVAATMAAMPEISSFMHAQSQAGIIGRRGDEPSLYAQAKEVLNRFCVSNEASLCYLLSSNGDVLLENRFKPSKSLEGDNYSFRPYFFKALKEGHTVYAAYGLRTQQRGIYFGNTITNREGDVLGVAVVKVKMTKFEGAFDELGGTPLLVDPQGIVFATSRHDWLLKSLWPLSEKVQALIKANRQYAGIHINDLGFNDFADKTGMYREGYEEAYLTAESFLSQLPGWRLLYFKPVRVTGFFSDSIISVVSLLFLIASFTSVMLFKVGLIDLKRRRSAEEELINSELRLRQLSELSNEGILIHQQGRILDSNKAAEQIFGYSREELLNSDIWNLMAPDCVSTAVSNMLSGYERPYDIEGKHRDGGIFPVEICARDSLLRGNGVRVCCIRDLSQSQTQVTDRMDKAIESARQRDAKLSVIYMDLDNFKRFNDNWGHEFGDRILMATAQRLRATLTKNDSLIRYGGDEFVIIFSGTGDEQQVVEKVNDLIQKLKSEWLIDDRKVCLTATFGIAVYPEHGGNSKELMQNAELAMYRCREQGVQGHFSFYSNEMSLAVKEQLLIEQHLREVLRLGELSLVYQPVYAERSNKLHLASAEVLLRWNSGVLGVVGPDKFIPIAEHTGQIIEIGQWVLTRSCRQGKLWIDQGHKLTLAVNVSPRQLRHPDYISQLEKVLYETEFPAEQLCLEVTEGILLEDDQYVETILRQIKAMGVMLSIDDFGTGYSSLSYLKRYPFDTLKIDRSFMMDLEEHSSHQQLVKACILMAHGLNLNVVAEGVETDFQLGMLKNLNCDYFQGYLLNRPLPDNDLTDLLRKQS
ncbi:EAL domain-containing protein [Neptuniibacter caesariensis]|uniref:GGDEF domain-containing protein n=1 Tax=Neptuniibacter caesariensis TaxID=207954 RepID=A0A7U8GSJ3_NEPCE|nr:EAL domain-containing protein [Neptuniibacter caesariensis]EAR61312.1 hypothetical protein MED92_11314 [Oceanospirillum sp. MED92] [Neptuniibacter caesariensis]